MHCYCIPAKTVANREKNGRKVVLFHCFLNKYLKCSTGKADFQCYYNNSNCRKRYSFNQIKKIKGAETVVGMI